MMILDQKKINLAKAYQDINAVSAAGGSETWVTLKKKDTFPCNLSEIYIKK